MILANHVDSQAAKARASKQGLGRVKHVVVRCMFAEDVANKKHATLAHVNTKSDLMMMRRGHSASSQFFCFGKLLVLAPDVCSYSFGAGENQFVKQFQFSTGKAFF